MYTLLRLQKSHHCVAIVENEHIRVGDVEMQLPVAAGVKTGRHHTCCGSTLCLCVSYVSVLETMAPSAGPKRKLSWLL